MNFWQDMLIKISSVKDAISKIKSKDVPLNISGFSQIHKAHFVHTLNKELGKTVVVIVADEADGHKLCTDIEAFGSSAALLPVRDISLYGIESFSKEYEQKRLGIFSDILERGVDVVVASVAAACEFTIPPSVLQSRKLTIRKDAPLPSKDVASELVKYGYERTHQVESVGQFAVRGGIIDIFPANAADPVRIELWGDVVDTLYSFDYISQRRTEPLEHITVPPAAEILYDDSGVLADKIDRLAKKHDKKTGNAKKFLQNDIKMLCSGGVVSSYDKYISLIYDEKATLFDYAMESGALICISEWTNVKDRLKSFNAHLEESVKLMLENGEMVKELISFCLDENDFDDIFEQHGDVILDTFQRTKSHIKLHDVYNVSSKQLPVWSGSLDLLVEDIAFYRDSHMAIVVLAGIEKNAKILVSDLQNRGISAKFATPESKISAGDVLVMVGGISSGLEYPEIGMAVITHGRIAVTKKRRQNKKDRGMEIHSISELVVNDYIVHAAHGIGVFKGIDQINMQGIVKDYLKLEYARRDVLYVPVTQLDLVSKYIGSKEDISLKLHKLGGQEWQSTKSRVKSAVKDIAKELIILYAKRMSAPGFAFDGDTEWQLDFEQRFEYQETEDQSRAVDEIKADMEKSAPMDRLLCGDVGFGKTEVAFRAAFKCVSESKQCAILVPTTILALQHYNTAIKRFEGFPVNIEVVSRFNTAKDFNEITSKLRTGEVDMLIGTHKMLSKDVKFHDIGLLVVDEEQRFGVSQKEKIKEIAPNVDVLTLSATPIPRTLNMAMSGVRDMSTIEEAPQDRKPVQTYVVEHDNNILTEAIHRELRRGGQVFYLHNRVESIEEKAARLQMDFPDALVGFAHGKMNETELAKAWRMMLEQEIDILVCTTIIETGIDIPNANTLIIENADRFGLSQLHQIRGRVGRSGRRAFAYLTFRRGKALSEIATKRLEAVREFTAFGAGFKISMRDMELRGAGNILGASQHGHMECVGYEMYLRLLNDAINEEKGIKVPDSEDECLVDLQVSAHIPNEYISVNSQRLDVYRRIAEVRSTEDSLDVYDELIDRFGEPPEAVQSLVDVALLRSMAAQKGFYEIKQQSNKLLLYPRNLDMELASKMSAALKGRVMISAGAKPYYSVGIKDNLSALDTLREALDALSA